MSKNEPKFGHHDEDEHVAKAINHLAETMKHGLKSLTDAILKLDPLRATHAKFTFLYKGAPMAIVLQQGQGATGTTVFQKLTDTEQVVAPIGPVVYAVTGDPDIVTIDANGNWTQGAGAGTATGSALDQGDGITASDGVAVGATPPAVATHATFQFIVNPTKRR